MTATFRGHEGRHLVVYGDAKVPGRFVGVAVVVDTVDGGVQGGKLEDGVFRTGWCLSVRREKR